MTDPHKLGVVTVTYNSGKVIDGFLTSLLRQTHGNFILYVIDNASADRTLEQIAACGDRRIRVIANPDNRGIAEANNQGTQAALAAGCGLVLLMNNDTEFDAGLLRAIAGRVGRT